jgi:hypothetical protein
MKFFGSSYEKIRLCGELDKTYYDVCYHSPLCNFGEWGTDGEDSSVTRDPIRRPYIPVSFPYLCGSVELFIIKGGKRRCFERGFLLLRGDLALTIYFLLMIVCYFAERIWIISID